MDWEMTEQSSQRLTITVTEAAKRLGIGKNQAYEGVHRGQIPSIRVGKRILIPLKALQRMLERSE